MKTKILLSISLLVILSFTAIAQQQDNRFAVELALGPSFSLGKVGTTDVQTGIGSELYLHYSLLPQLGIYGGWGWNHFSAKGTDGQSIDGYEETGYAIGLKYLYPLANSPLRLYLRGGAIYKHLEIENDEGDIVGDTGHGWGWQAATGVEIDVKGGWCLTPGAKFNSVSRSWGQENTTLNLDYLGIRVGILKTF